MFNVSVPAKSEQAADAATALNAAFSKAAADLVTWTLGLNFGG